MRALLSSRGRMAVIAILAVLLLWIAGDMLEVRFIYPVRAFSLHVGFYWIAATGAPKLEVPPRNLEVHRFRQFAECESEINADETFS